MLLVAMLPRGARSDVPPSVTEAVRVGDLAPDFTLQAFDGRELALADHLGEKPLLVVFWSFFCFPCQRELPRLEELYQELGPGQLAVIGISLDGPQFDERVLPFIRQKGITFPNAYDRETEEFFEVAERYGVVGTPTSFLVDAQGRVRFVHLGRIDSDALKSLVRTAGEQTFCPEITKPISPPSR